jgi:hypothetical protein
MTGYELYCSCRRLMNRSIPELDTYLNSKEKPYYEMLRDYFIGIRKLDLDEIKDYLRVIYNDDMVAFDPYKWMEEENWNRYIEWRKTSSTKSLYQNQIRNSFLFIENFCINKSINLSKYKLSHAAKHIREKKIDWAVAVHLQLINIKKLSKVEKILLKNYISQYNILQSRLYNQELSELMTNLTEGMIKLLKEYHLDT